MRGLAHKLSYKHFYPLYYMGLIAAGQPLDIMTESMSLDLGALQLGPNRYALKVQGDAMADEGIRHNDLIICRPQTHASNGDIVVTIVDKCEILLRRWQWVNAHTVSLIPANSTLPTLIYNVRRLEVRGIFVGLIRFERQ